MLWMTLDLWSSFPHWWALDIMVVSISSIKQVLVYDSRLFCFSWPLSVLKNFSWWRAWCQNTQNCTMRWSYKFVTDHNKQVLTSKHLVTGEKKKSLKLPGADPRFSGGGGGQKIMYIITWAKPKVPYGRGPGPVKGPWKLLGFLMLTHTIWALFLSILISVMLQNGIQHTCSLSNFSGRGGGGMPVVHPSIKICHWLHHITNFYFNQFRVDWNITIITSGN